MLIIIDNYSESNQNIDQEFGYSNIGSYQSFEGDGNTLDSVKFYLKRGAIETSGNITANIRAHTGTYGTSSEPTGSDLAVSDNYDSSNLTTSYQLVEFTFSGDDKITLTDGTKYCVCVFGWDDGNGSRYVGADDSSPTHDGNAGYDGVGWWEPQSGVDLCFYVYGETPLTITAKAAILKSTSKTVTAKARIQKSFTQTVGAHGWIQGMPTHLHRAYQDGSSYWYYELNTSNRMSALRFIPWSNIDVTEVSVYLRNVVSPPTYRVGIRADDGGDPAGAWLTSETVTPSIENNWVHVTVPKYTLQAGTTYWLVMAYESGTVGGSNYVRHYLHPDNGSANYQYDGQDGNLRQSSSSDGGSNWSLSSEIGAAFLLNQMFGNPMTSWATSPIYGDRLRGQYFQLRNSLTINTFATYIRKDGTPGNDILYEIRDTDENVLRSGTLAAEADVTESYQKFEVVLSSPITFDAGKGYRIIVRMTNGDIDNGYDVSVNSIADYTVLMSNATYGGGIYAQFCGSNDAGSSWFTASDYYKYDFFVEGLMTRTLTAKAALESTMSRNMFAAGWILNNAKGRKISARARIRYRPISTDEPILVVQSDEQYAHYSGQQLVKLSNGTLVFIFARTYENGGISYTLATPPYKTWLEPETIDDSREYLGTDLKRAVAKVDSEDNIHVLYGENKYKKLTFDWQTNTFSVGSELSIDMPSAAEYYGIAGSLAIDSNDRVYITLAYNTGVEPDTDTVGGAYIDSPHTSVTIDDASIDTYTDGKGIGGYGEGLVCIGTTVYLFLAWGVSGHADLVLWKRDGSWGARQTVYSEISSEAWESDAVVVDENNQFHIAITDGGYGMYYGRGVEGNWESMETLLESYPFSPHHLNLFLEPNGEDVTMIAHSNSGMIVGHYIAMKRISGVWDYPPYEITPDTWHRPPDGVLLYDSSNTPGKAWYDGTADMANRDVNYLEHPNTGRTLNQAGDVIYVGHKDKFHMITYSYNLAPGTYTFVYEYWNGSIWQSFMPTSPPTFAEGNLTANLWKDRDSTPGDWETETIDEIGIKNRGPMYWFRARLTEASFTDTTIRIGDLGLVYGAIRWVGVVRNDLDESQSFPRVVLWNTVDYDSETSDRRSNYYLTSLDSLDSTPIYSIYARALLGAKIISAKASIEGVAATIQTITSLARIQKQVSQTVSTLGSISKQATKTITSKGRIQISSTQTVTAIGNIKISGSQTVTAIGRISKQGSQTTTAKSRIELSSTQTITTLARIQRQGTQTITSLARIQVQKIKTITAKGRIIVSVSQTISGKARIQFTTSKTLTAKGRVGLSSSQTVQALGRIQKQGSHTISALGRIQITSLMSVTALARIQLSLTQTLTALGRIQIASTQTLDALAAILKSQTKTLTALGRVQQGFNQSVDTKANLKATTSRTLTAAGRIQLAEGQSIDAKASIKKTSERTVSALARIQEIFTQSVDALGRITDTFAQTIKSLGKIQVTTNQTLYTLARIQRQLNKTVSAIGRIQIAGTQIISALGRVQLLSEKTIDAKARIQQPEAQTIEALGNILKNVQQTVTALANIQYLTREYTITALANIIIWGEWSDAWELTIYETLTQTIEALASIKKSAEQTIDVLGRIQISGQQTIEALGRIGVAGVVATIDAKGNIRLIQITTIDAKGSINKQATQTTDAKGRITITTSQTINAKGNKVAGQTETIETKGRITKTPDQTIDSLGRIQKQSTQAITALGRITVSVSREISAKGRIQESFAQTVDAKARITTSPAQTIEALADIVKEATRTIEALGRIAHISTGATIDAKGNIKKTQEFTVSAGATVSKTITQSIQTLGRLQRLEIQTISTRANIITGLTRTIEALGRITNTYTQTLEALGRIQKRFSATINALARIGISPNQTIDSKGKITATTSVTIEALARIGISGAREIDAKARITRTYKQEISAKGRIQVASEQNIDAKGRITITSEQSVTARGRITITGEQTVDTKGRIQIASEQAINSKGRIQISNTQTVGVLGRISTIENQTIDAKGSIFRTFQQNINVKASIENTFTKTVEAKGRIKIGKIETVETKARITTTQSQTIDTKGNIFSTTEHTVVTKANIIHVAVEQTIQSRANIIQSTSRTVSAKGSICTYEVIEIIDRIRSQDLIDEITYVKSKTETIAYNRVKVINITDLSRTIKTNWVTAKAKIRH